MFKKVFGTIIFILIVGISVHSAYAETRSNTITLSQFSQLSAGMSREKVIQIIGQPGEETTKSGNAVIYQYNNGDVYLLFDGDKLENKMQVGLK